MQGNNNVAVWAQLSSGMHLLWKSDTAIKKSKIDYYKYIKSTYKVVVESCISIEVASNQSEWKTLSRESSFIDDNK